MNLPVLNLGKPDILLKMLSRLFLLWILYIFCAKKMYIYVIFLHEITESVRCCFVTY